MGVIFQVLCTMIICCIGINLGLTFVWPASTLKLFASANTPLNRPMTETEIALLGSLSAIGGLLCNPVAGFVLDKLGRKNSSILCAAITVLSWSILALSNRVEFVLTGVLISGFSSSAILIGSTYISEICQNSIRGAMTSCILTAYSIGVLLSYLGGGYLEYHMNIYVRLAISVAGLIVLCILKDSPVYLMAKGREEEAAKSVAYFRNTKLESKEVIEEINNIQRALNPEMNETPEEEKLNSDLKPIKKISTIQFIKKSRSTRRAMFVSFVLVTATIFQGLIVVQIYAEPLFEEAIPTVSPTLCSLMFAGTIVISGLLAAYLTERAGRRALMIYSSIGVGLSCVVLGTQIHLHWGPSWLTAISLFSFTVLYTCGAGSVPFVLVAELFLPEVKAFVSILVMQWMWICTFTILFIFNPLMNLIGLGPVFYIFAIICFFTAIFCVFFLPETKGLTVDVIQTLFIRKNNRSCTRI